MTRPSKIQAQASVKVLSLYCEMMGEIKVRVQAITQAITGQLGIHPFIAHEIAYLQLRMICKLIAFFRSVAHGDVVAKSGSDLLKAYEADKIMLKLGRLHETFYPQPVRQILDEQGNMIRTQSVTDLLDKNRINKTVEKLRKYITPRAAKDLYT